MATSAFDNFIQRQQAKKQELSEIDVDRQLVEWQEHLKTLYHSVEVYMSAYIDSGAVIITYRPIEINEEFSGPYKVDLMSLTIGPSVIVFEPIGTMLIGSKGRVDVHGPHGIARLVLVNRKISEARQLIHASLSSNELLKQPDGKQNDESADWAWKLATPVPDMRFIDLDQSAFYQMILSVSDA